MIDRRAVLAAAAGTAMAGLASGPARADTAATATEAILHAEMRERGIPGLQFAVARKGRIVQRGGLGVADNRYAAPVRGDTLFPIFSCTKGFTGVAVMQLVEAGRLDLAAPVSRSLPDLPEAWRPITLLQLVSHSSGLPNIINNGTGRLIADTEAATWTRVRAMPLMFPPGERFSYSQTNPALIGQIIETLTGMPATKFISKRQFEPAGMSHTGFGDSLDVTPNKTTSYSRRYPDPMGQGELRHHLSEAPEPRRTATGMISTADDLALWLMALQAGKLLGPEARRLLWTPVAFKDGRPGDWGVSWMVTPRPAHRFVGMTGGSATAYALYPEDDLAVVVLTNLSGGYPEDSIDQIAAAWIPDMRLNGVAALRQALRGRDYAEAPALVERLKRDDPDFRLGEGQLNDWAYRLLRGGKPLQAIELFKLNAALYPASGNTFDSLADGYGVIGRKDLAIVNYRRSLELDPGNRHAVEQLKRLEAP